MIHHSLVVEVPIDLDFDPATFDATRWTPLVKVSVRVPDSLTSQEREPLKEAEHFANCRYLVARRFCGEDPGRLGKLWHLSIRENDRGHRHDWRDFQLIKNELVGPEAEGIEIYPPESRLVDSANQDHLFVFERPLLTEAIGFSERLVSGDGEGRENVRQRPFAPEHLPKELRR